MKLFITILSITLILAASGFAGEKVLGIQAGINATAFEDQDEGASTLNFGATFGVKALPMVETGLEFNMLAKPWEFETKDEYATMTHKFTQTMIGAYAKVNIPLVVVNPYVKAGLGYYMGKVEAEFEEWGETASAEEDLKGALGFSLGAGVETFLGFYGELMFHIVEREFDVEDAEAFGANNVAINVGYRFTF